MSNTINIIKIINIHNKNYNFDSSLDCSQCIHIKNSSNIRILLNSKINKIILENSQKIYLDVCDLIIGVEISKSKSIIINYKENTLIPMIDLYKSSLFLYGALDKYKKQRITCESSDIYNIE